MGGGVSKFLTFGDLVNKNEKQSSYVSLKDLLEKDQTPLFVTSFTTSTPLISSPKKTNIGGCGNYTTIEKYDKQNLEDEKLSSPSFVRPYLNYPNDFSLSNYNENENKGYFFDISSKSLPKEGLKEKNNNNLLPQVEGIVGIEDTMGHKALKGRMFIEDLKEMLLDVMNMLKTNERLRVHIVLEQVSDSENEKKDDKNSKGRV